MLEGRVKEAETAAARARKILNQNIVTSELLKRIEALEASIRAANKVMRLRRHADVEIESALKAVKRAEVRKEILKH